MAIFCGRQTQQEIAHELGLSRQVAQRLISLAKEGMVQGANHAPDYGMFKTR